MRQKTYQVAYRITRGSLFCCLVVSLVYTVTCINEPHLSSLVKDTKNQFVPRVLLLLTHAYCGLCGFGSKTVITILSTTEQI